jgi:hypothetical protein
VPDLLAIVRRFHRLPGQGNALYFIKRLAGDSLQIAIHSCGRLYDTADLTLAF